MRMEGGLATPPAVGNWEHKLIFTNSDLSAANSWACLFTTASVVCVGFSHLNGAILEMHERRICSIHQEVLLQVHSCGILQVLFLSSIKIMLNFTFSDICEIIYFNPLAHSWLLKESLGLKLHLRTNRGRFSGLQRACRLSCLGLGLEQSQ